MNRPALIHWALWQEAVEPSQSDPFPPQPQCEVHSPSRNKYGNIQEHRLQFHSKHFPFLHWVSTCRPDSDRGQPGRKKTKRCGLSWEENFEAEYWNYKCCVPRCTKFWSSERIPFSCCFFPPALDLWVPVQPCVCVWVGFTPQSRSRSTAFQWLSLAESICVKRQLHLAKHK